MREFANKPEDNLLSARASDGKTHCIPIPIRRKSRTSGSIAKIAELAQIRLGRDNRFF
jgi:hypothetical protein